MFSERFRSRPLPSIRLWLQSTSLLAVVAGYSLLFLVGGSIRSDAIDGFLENIDAYTDSWADTIKADDNLKMALLEILW